MTRKVSNHLCGTGVEGLDKILGGGVPEHRLYLLQGEPGTGKTTLALQFLLEGEKQGQKGLYISFSETRNELQAVAKSHEWDISNLELLEMSAIESQLAPESQNTVFHPSEVEINQITQILLSEVERTKPTRVVFDSVLEMRMLAETPIRYRRQMLSLKQFFSGRKCTVFLLDDLTSSAADLQVQSIVHGVINLQKRHPEFGGERRRLNIVKLRGVKFSGGYHDYVISTGGLQVFQRMVSSDHQTTGISGVISSGIPRFDQLLGGGLNLGTSNLFLGPAGTGKSTLAMQFAFAAAERGENAGIFVFEESMGTLLLRTEALGIGLTKHVASGKIHLQQIDPAELSPGEFTHQIAKLVSDKKIKVLVIDSLNGYLHAMPEEQFLLLQLHELLSYLSSQGVATLMVLAQIGLMGPMQNPIDLTYLADTVIITRYFEVTGAVKKAVSIIKKRSGGHEPTIREFNLSPKGLTFGEPITNFQGILSGVPMFHRQNFSEDG